MKPALWIITSAVCLSPVVVQASDWQDCVPITEDRVRLACYDKLARSLAAAPPERPATTTASIERPITPKPVSNQALGNRIENEKIAGENPFSIRAYKPNYILPVTYTSNRLNSPVYDFNLQHAEAKYQLSFQFNWWDHPLGPNTAFYFGYTQLSLWQLYNSSVSSPFRETDYEPEVGLDLTTDMQLAGLDFRKIRASFIHQSNGQGGLRSRSWNRLALLTAFGQGNFAGAIRGWYRIPESRTSDDNPDISDYLGYGDLTLAYKFPTGTLSATLRNNLKSNNRGAIEIDYSFPFNRHIKGYIQYFNGYGESLIDYNRSVNRIGIGIALTDWL
jgi:phospholipase A1/A2